MTASFPNNLSILVVDPDPAMARVAQLVFADLGAKCEIAEDPVAGLNAARAKQKTDQPYDVVVLAEQSGVPKKGHELADAYAQTGTHVVIADGEDGDRLMRKGNWQTVIDRVYTKEMLAPIVGALGADSVLSCPLAQWREQHKNRLRYNPKRALIA